MNMRGLFSAICCIMTVVGSFHALAQELDEVVEQNGDDIVIAKRPQRPPWESTFETTWLTGSHYPWCRRRPHHARGESRFYQTGQHKPTA